MPENAAGIRGSESRGSLQGKIFDALGVKMNFAVVIAGETLKKLCEGAFRAVAAVNERGDDGEAQVSVPGSAGSAVLLECLRTALRR